MSAGRHPASPSTTVERFEWALGTGEGADDGDTGPLLSLAEQIRAVGAATLPTAEFRITLRERLMNPSAAVLQLPVRGRHRCRRWRRLVLTVAAAAAAMTAPVALIPPPAATGPAALADRRVDQPPVQAAQLASAAATIRELSPAAAQSRPQVVTLALLAVDISVRGATAQLTVAAVEGGDRTQLEGLARWARTQRQLLAPVAASAVEPAQTSIREFSELLGRVETRAVDLAGLVGCSCLGRAGYDDLGPLPCRGCGAAPGPLPPPTMPTSRPGTSAPSDRPSERSVEHGR